MTNKTREMVDLLIKSSDFMTAEEKAKFRAEAADLIDDIVFEAALCDELRRMYPDVIVTDELINKIKIGRPHEL